MRKSVGSAAASLSGVRTIVGAAPVLHLAQPTPALPKEQQIAKNTNIALDMIKRFKGEAPKSYTRRHTQTFDVVEKEVDLLLGGAEKMRKAVTDDQPMDKLTVMERCLRHAVWQYLKDEGKADFDAMNKWLVYTEHDEQQLAALRRDVDLKSKLQAFRAKKAANGAPAAVLPMFDWEKEYAKTIDRELVVEKRVRYDTIAVNTTERDEAKIEELLASYRKPVQDERLDRMIDLLERFKPMLAREAILQRLTIKHLEGQLGVWRYMDWMPEVRDRAELESDNYCHHWWLEAEEKRMLSYRLRSKKEVRDVMEKKQADILASQNTGGDGPVASGGNKNEARDKLLAEVLALQARVGRAREEKA